ncbi:MAG: tetratricopeptide repeat protein [Bacteroidota bacterium]
MSIIEKQFQLIIKHFDQSLSEPELKEFDSLIENSGEFRNEVKIMEDIIDSSAAFHRAEEFKYIKEKFTEFDLESKRKPKSRILRRYFAMAASVTIILVVSIFYFQNPGFDAQKAFIENYELFPVKSSVRNTQKKLFPGIEYYKQGNFQEAIPLLEQYSKDDIVNCLYLSNAYIETGNFQKAESTLNKFIPKIDDRIIKRYGIWYLGLSLLAQNKIEDAEGQFLLLAEEKGPFHKQSKVLVEALKSR